MRITDIISKGKDFEPPFKTDDYGMYVFDNNNQMMLEIRGWGYLSYQGEEIAEKKQKAIANHICELLNREHNKSNSNG